MFKLWSIDFRLFYPIGNFKLICKNKVFAYSLSNLSHFDNSKSFAVSVFLCLFCNFIFYV